MPTPSTMADLSTTAASNSPASTDTLASGDDVIRAISAILRTTNAKGSDIASASSIDLGAATGEFVDVTGTTTITGLGTVAAGIVRTVRFTGALTLTHNATSLILPGGANITTANGDCAQFRSLGSGNWVCVAYVPAAGYIGASSTATLTNKTINLTSNTLTGTTAQFNTALSDGDFATLAGSETLTNKSVSLASNTLTGTKAQFNSACSDGDFLYVGDVSASDVTSTNTVTLTNKTMAALTNNVEARSGPDSSAFSFRNKIIGGDFTTNPWQRGTTFTNAANDTYTADRFAVRRVDDAQVTILKTADAPTAAQAGVYATHCFHADVTTADASIAAGQLYCIDHRIEGLNAASFGFGQAGTRYVTLSFWHKHTKTGTYCVAFGASGNARMYVAEYTQDVTNTWEQAVITIPVDTSGTWLYDTSIGLRLIWSLAAGTDYQQTAGTWTSSNDNYATSNQVNALDSTSNDFKLALIQLEAGQTATPFETRPYGVELALCQRYYYRQLSAFSQSDFGAGYVGTTSTGSIITPFPVTMRTAPTALEQSGTAGDYAVLNAGISTTCTSVPAFAIAGITTARTTFTTGATLTVGHGCIGRSLVSTAYLGWSAEL